jgi:fumarylacetoacetase
LDSVLDHREGGLNISLEAWLSTQSMREVGAEPVRLTSTHLSNLSWSFAQMLTHHSSNGCNLNPGDLIGSGTISGERDEERACLTEITNAGRTPMSLPNGEQRLWLHDGDEVTLKARASAPDRISIGFGLCSGRILPAFTYPHTPVVAT